MMGNSTYLADSAVKQSLRLYILITIATILPLHSMERSFTPTNGIKSRCDQVKNCIMIIFINYNSLLKMWNGYAQISDTAIKRETLSFKIKEELVNLE